jgi:excisionase family DNA binding protein
MEDWITTAEASELSGYHPERIRELAREEKIVARKWGSAYQISRESLLQYLLNAIEVGDKRFGPKKNQPKT